MTPSESASGLIASTPSYSVSSCTCSSNITELSQAARRRDRRGAAVTARPRGRARANLAAIMNVTVAVPGRTRTDLLVTFTELAIIMA